MATLAPAPVENRFVTWTRWAGYLKFLEAVGERPIRVTYDRGKIEIMSPSFRHERFKSLLSRLVDILLVEWEMDFAFGGSTTFKRQDLDRGLEPDECYWLANAAAMEGVDDWDPARHPPPDLVVEIDVASSSMDRIGIYAAMGVPEVWRVAKDGTLTAHLLDRGSYRTAELSTAFPSLPLSVVREHLFLAETLPPAAILKRFRDRVRALPRP